MRRSALALDASGNAKYPGCVSSTSFAVDLQDIHFVLFDQLEMQRKLAQHGRYAELDRDVYEATLAEAKRLAEEVLGPINKTGDRVGCKLDGEGNVTTPPGYKEAWKILAEGGTLPPR